MDETTRVETRLSTRIRVPLDPTFFQERIINMEGTTSLESNAAFQEAVKGMIIRTENFSEDLYMLLNIAQATIKVEYDYYKYNTNGTPDDDADDVTERATKEFSIGLSGIQINTLKNHVTNFEIQEQLNISNSESPTHKIYVQGGKYLGKIRLF